jgi:ubiquinol-cytochrome c reductase cytochrome b/c1 subunit
MAGLNNSEFKNPLINWLDTRLPLFTMLQKEYGVFPTPRNFNYLWNFGAIAMFILVTMIITGITLAMQYTADTGLAFNSVERIMRDVNYGWLIRYIHMNGASMFFIAVYIHIFRGLYYGSYKRPRELLWIFGVLILLLMMATAFMGYVLPWGQMSFWGATVITNLFSAIPLVGDSIVTWLWGGFSVDNPTLTRFFALHYLLPFVIVAVVFMHVWALHVTGSNNPLGIEPKGPGDTIPFHPYYTTKDMFGLTVFLMIFAAFVFFAPNYLGHPDNYVPANPLVTPPHIVPEWYFLPFYAILRAITFDIGIPFTDIILIDSKLGGVLAMFGAIACLFVLPWLDNSPVRSARFRPMFKRFFWLLVIACIALGFAGAKPAEGMWLYIAQAGTAYYFAHFLIILPWLSRNEKTLPLPESICQPVLKKGAVAMLALLLLAPTPSYAASDALHPIDATWPQDGVFGTFDRAALQRGYQVYKEVCAACHAMKLVKFRNLTEIGLTEAQVKALAGEYTISDGPDDNGDMFDRPRLPSDPLPSPFANEQAARAANGGAYPKDLSLIIKARHGGEDYLFSLLTGYKDAPNGEVREGQYYNPYFAGGWIGMASPIAADGQVTYADGTVATKEQMARDVTQFLAWASEPHMEARKQMGVKVMIFLFVLACFMYVAKKRVWKDIKH